MTRGRRRRRLKLAPVTAQSVVEQGRNNKWCETRSIGSLKYKNLKLRKEDVTALSYGLLTDRLTSMARD